MTGGSVFISAIIILFGLFCHWQYKRDMKGFAKN